MKTSYLEAWMFFILLIDLINNSQSATVPNHDDILRANITMKNFETTQEDEYACVSFEIPDEELYIVGYSPLITMSAAHHMLTYACGAPASTQPYWTGVSTCASASMIIHGWARNAPALNLPEDVGFAVGKNTPFKYIVLNIHYLSIMKNDNSGNQIIFSRTPRKYHAGIMLGGSGEIYIPPKTRGYRTRFSCAYEGPPISIFAVRVHAHQWARVNSLYRVRDGKVSQIVKSDPQWPQSFYPLPDPVNVEKGDYLLGQCVYDNNENRAISSGASHHDEMCNIYTMYSFEVKKTLDGKSASDTVPGQMCWGDLDKKMSSLIPADSLIPPLKPADIGGSEGGHHAHEHTEHAMNVAPANLYTSIQTWPDAKSLPTQSGEIGGIALTNANNELVVFFRGSRRWESKYFDGVRFVNERYGPIDENVLIHIDTSTGQTKSQWGAKMFYMPHGLTIDHEGNFWLTDIAMHQVFMFKPNDFNHPSLTVGEMFKSGSGPSQLCRPADVVVMKNGDFFVADGYCNSRIVKFSRKGEYLMEWGSPMSGKRDADGFPLPNEWNIVHSLALNEEAQLICGADRENSRIQCFNSNTGDFLRQIRVEKDQNIGPIYAIEFAPNANGTILFAVTGGGQIPTKKVYMIDARTGDILTSFESNPQFNAPHDITVSANGREIYVGELAASLAVGLHKFELSKEKDLPTQTFIKQIYNNDKNFRISLILLATFAIPVLVAVVIGCLIRVRNMRKLHHLNVFLDDVKTGGINRSSVLGSWMNRRQGFERLEQHSDGENEPFDSNNGDDSNDETVTFTTNQQATEFNNKTITGTFKVGNDL